MILIWLYFIGSLIREYLRILTLVSISYIEVFFNCTPLNTDEYWKIRGLTEGRERLV